MPDTSHPDHISRLAQAMAERLAPLCEHVPAGELAELTSRLATSELMRAGGGGATIEELTTTLGNQVVWLSGPSGAAIVLPAGEADPAPLSSLAQLLDQARSQALRAGERASRGSAALRQRAAAMVSAWQVRPRAELPDR